MATLTNETVASTYTYLLKMDGTSGITSSLVKIQDGDATQSALSIGTTSIAIDAGDKLGFDGTNTGTYITESADGVLDFYADSVKMLTLKEGAQDEVVINEGGADIDFRVESANDANMIFVNGSNDRVGIGVNPATKFQVESGVRLGNITQTSSYDDHIVILCDGGTVYEGGLLINNCNDATAGNSSVKLNVTNSGIGADTADFHVGLVENNDPNNFNAPGKRWFWCDGPSGDVMFNSGGDVGIGTDSPAAKLQVVNDTSTDLRGAFSIMDSGQSNHAAGQVDFTPFVSDSVPASGYMDVEISNTGGWLFIHTQNGGYAMFYLYMGSTGTLSSNHQLGASSSEITITQPGALTGTSQIRITNGDASYAVVFRGLFFGNLGQFRIVNISS